MNSIGIKKDQHGLADYVYVPAVFAAPALAGFSSNRQAANICRAFSLAALGYTLFTDASWGAVKVIPYKAHVCVDLISGVLSFAALAVPAISKNSAAKQTFMAMGITGLVVGILSLKGAYAAE